MTRYPLYGAMLIRVEEDSEGRIVMALIGESAGASEPEPEPGAGEGVPGES